MSKEKATIQEATRKRKEKTARVSRQNIEI